MGTGRSRSKHWRVRVRVMPVDHGGGHIQYTRVKVLTPAGRRRRDRRRRLIGGINAVLASSPDVPLREAFQVATRLLGTRPDDRRWAWSYCNAHLGGNHAE